MGVTTNSWFWICYRRLNKANPNTILAVQSSLYRTKALVEICVTAALIVVTVSPGSLAAYFMDIAGSAAIAVYLLINGVIKIFNKKQRIHIAAKCSPMNDIISDVSTL